MPHGWLALLTPASHLAAAGFLLFAALHDIAARTVPNWVACAVILVGLTGHAYDNNLLIGLAAAFIVFLVAALCWRRGWLGGADVKLMGASVVAVPSGQILTFIVAMSIAGSLFAAVYMTVGAVARRFYRPTAVPTLRPTRLPARVVRAEMWRLRRGGPLPYACAIAAGFLFVQL